MSALEIVLISVLGAFILVVIMYYLVLTTNTQNRLQVFKILNKDPVKASIVFFGDSLTDFFPLQDFFPEHAIYNRGIAGDTTKNLLKRIDNIVELHPQKLFIQIGTNDLGKGKKVKKVVDNIMKIHDYISHRSPETKIHIISLYPVSHHKMWLSPFISGLRSNNKIREVNYLLAEKCSAQNISFINIHPLLINAKGRLKKEYTIEGLHISGQGYQVIADALRSYL